MTPVVMREMALSIASLFIRRVLLVGASLISAAAFAGIRPLDPEVCESWERVCEGRLSEDGRTAGYIVTSVAMGKRELNVVSVEDGTVLRLPNCESHKFAGDRLYALQKNGDLSVLHRGRLRKLEERVTHFQSVSREEGQVLLIARAAGSVSIWIDDTEKIQLAGGGEFWISPRRDGILVECSAAAKNAPAWLEWIDFTTFSHRTIWSGFRMTSPTYSDGGDMITFGCRIKGRLAVACVSLRTTDEWESPMPTGEAPAEGMLSAAYFVDDDKLILVESTAPRQTTRSGDPAQPRVWSSTNVSEPKTRSAGETERQYCLFSTKTHESKIVDVSGGLVVGATNSRNVYAEAFLVPPGSVAPFWRQPYSRLVAHRFKEGTVTELSRAAANVTQYVDGRFLVWFDQDHLSWRYYDFANQKAASFGPSNGCAAYDEQALRLNRKLCFGAYGWRDDGARFVFYDRYDIWEFDCVTGATRCLTNEYGRKQKICFSVAKCDSAGPSGSRWPRMRNGFLCAAFNGLSKVNGVWWAPAEANSDPQLLFEGKVVINVPRIDRAPAIDLEIPNDDIFTLTRSVSGEVYLFAKCSASTAPNYFVTKDFVSQRPVSEASPTVGNNWMTCEVLTWDDARFVGRQGMLYKPGDFSPDHKYPTLITYYGNRSAGTNMFLTPEWSANRMNIPYFVSRGYVVFVPDMEFYDSGHNGAAALESVLSGLSRLEREAWFDRTRVGIQGHSFGGFLTNYFITHCNVFAAACEASGVSDHVSSYNQISGQRTERQSLYELNSQGSALGIGVTPWNSPRPYWDNSPVLKVNDVTTPLLMMHGTADVQVPFAQATEFFMALRRAEKRVWLLEYEGQGHNLATARGPQPSPARDFTKKMEEFFGYYLKGERRPDWMR